MGGERLPSSQGQPQTPALPCSPSPAASPVLRHRFPPPRWLPWERGRDHLKERGKSAPQEGMRRSLESWGESPTGRLRQGSQGQGGGTGPLEGSGGGGLSGHREGVGSPGKIKGSQGGGRGCPAGVGVGSRDHRDGVRIPWRGPGGVVGSQDGGWGLLGESGGLWDHRRGLWEVKGSQRRAGNPLEGWGGSRGHRRGPVEGRVEPMGGVGPAHPPLPQASARPFATSCPPTHHQATSACPHPRPVTMVTTS